MDSSIGILYCSIWKSCWHCEGIGDPTRLARPARLRSKASEAYRKRRWRGYVVRLASPSVSKLVCMSREPRVGHDTYVRVPYWSYDAHYDEVISYSAFWLNYFLEGGSCSTKELSGILFVLRNFIPLHLRRPWGWPSG